MTGGEGKGFLGWLRDTLFDVQGHYIGEVGQQCIMVNDSRSCHGQENGGKSRHGEKRIAR